MIKYALLTLVLLASPGMAGEPASGNEAVRIIVENAYLAPRRVAEVAAREEGPLTSVVVKEGAAVEADGLIAQLDDSDAMNTLKRSELNLQIAEKVASSKTSVSYATAQKAYAEAELRRADELRSISRDAVSDAEISTLRLDVARAEQELAKAREESELSKLTRQVREVERDSARIALGKRRIVAPFDGFVNRLYKSQGEWVKPGDSIARIVQLDRLVARASVDMKHFARDLEGSPATIQIMGLGSGDQLGVDEPSYPGRVTFINLETDAVNSEFELWAEFDNSKLRLTPGSRVRLTIYRGKQSQKNPRSDSGR